MRLFDQLTAREEQVLYLIARGCGNKAIACELQISVYTVQNHIQNLFEHLGVHNRTEAASHYWQRAAQAPKHREMIDINYSQTTAGAR